MYRDSQKRLTGNDVFEGYAIDLIKEVAEILSKTFFDARIWKEGHFKILFFAEFNYSFKWVDDHKYGKRNQESGEWNGMMGELLAQVSDSKPFFCLISELIDDAFFYF